MTNAVPERYRILGELGRGGMGVVYKALDTTLGRVVALKLLPVESNPDPERRQRFLNEARAASALNHPGIVTVHDLSSADGCDVLVMELVEGETLAERLTRGPCPLGEALRIAVQIADALARAHASGIVHRDLKASNVMVTPEGTAKVLDFGLAKLFEPSGGGTGSDTMRMRRQEHDLSGEGVLLGTVPYMSPEQTAGRSVDARSDVFSFGILLYELLTGRHPFRQPTALETLAAIRSAEPTPPSQLHRGVPAEVERVVLRCLEKEPARRWQGMADLKSVLEDCRSDSQSGRKRAVAGSSGSPSSWSRPLLVAVLAVVAAGGVLLWRRSTGHRAAIEAQRLTFDSGLTFGVDLSSDGKLAVYASDRGGGGNIDLWVQHVSQRSPVRLTRHEAMDWAPSFSPDGSRVVFRSERQGGGIYVVNTLGGEERLLAARGGLPRFSPDGAWVAFADVPAWSPAGLVKMSLVPADGGAPRPFAPELGLLPAPIAAGPVWSPDGRFILFEGARLDAPAEVDWWVAPVAGGPAFSAGAGRVLEGLDVLQSPVTWIPGSLLFLAGASMDGVNIYRVPITDAGAITGPPEPLTSGPGIAREAAVSADGRMAFSRFTWVIHLWGVELDPQTGEARGEPRLLTNDAASKRSVSLSRDGARLSYLSTVGSREARRTEIHVLDLRGGTDTVPMTGPASSLSLAPRLSADGRRLGWTDVVEGTPVAFVSESERTPARVLCRGCRFLQFLAREGQALVRLGPQRLVRAALEGGRQESALDIEAGEILDADASPDDEWLALALGRPDGTVSIQVRSLVGRAGGGCEIERSAVRLKSPRWSADGRFVYYLSQRDDNTCIWAQPLDPSTKERAGQAFPVLHLHDNPRRLWGPRNTFSIAVASDLLVFNAAEIRGDIYLGRLPWKERP